MRRTLHRLNHGGRVAAARRARMRHILQRVNHGGRVSATGGDIELCASAPHLTASGVCKRTTTTRTTTTTFVLYGSHRPHTRARNTQVVRWKSPHSDWMVEGNQVSIWGPQSGAALNLVNLAKLNPVLIWSITSDQVCPSSLESECTACYRNPPAATYPL